MNILNRAVPGLLILCFLLLLFQPIRSGIPVVDYGRILEFAAKYTEILKHWTEYIQKFKRHLDYQRFFNLNYLNVIKALTRETIDLLNPVHYKSLVDIIFNPRSYAYFSPEDIWHDIYSHVKTLWERYKETAAGIHLVKKTPLYRMNPHWRGYQDENIKNNRDILRQVEQMLNMVKDFKEMNLGRTNAMRQWKEMIDQAASPGGPSANRARLMALITVMELERLIMISQVNALVRENIAWDLKNDVIGTDSAIRLMELRDSQQQRLRLLEELVK